MEGRGVSEAIVESCRVRLRPILMTSLATIIGLMPMALKLGEGSESYAPLARALIGGLLVSVLLTVFLVPAGFFLAYRHQPTGSWKLRLRWPSSSSLVPRRNQIVRSVLALDECRHRGGILKLAAQYFHQEVASYDGIEPLGVGHTRVLSREL